MVSFWASWCGYCRKELPVLAGCRTPQARIGSKWSPSTRWGALAPALLILDGEGKVAYDYSGHGEDSLQDIVDAANHELAAP